MKKLYYYLYYITISCIITSCSFLSSNSQNIKINKTYSHYLPIKFTHNGINTYFRDILNDPYYRQEILPQNFNHIVQCIEYGCKRKQGLSYVQSMIRLFNNILKSSPYISAYAFNDFLEKITPILQTQCLPKKYEPTTDIKEHINNILYNHFLSKFDQFKNDPDTFFDGISHDISLYTHNPIKQSSNISLQEMQKTLMSFLEGILSKLIWSPEDALQTWQLTKKIALSLEQLLDQHILADEDDLNDLFTSLTERYALFLDISAQAIPIDCYQQIKKEIVAQNLYFLELDEQEPFLEKKSHRLMRTLLESEAKARASEYGIVTT